MAKKLLIGIVVFVALLGIIGVFMFGGRYNKMVEMEEGVNTAWSQVETQYQRRYDLIDNLLYIAEQSGELEKEILTGVIEARAKATSIEIDANNLTEANMAQFQEAQSQLSGSLSRLMLTMERYPNVQAVAGYRDVMNSLEGTENRIAVARTRYNEDVGAYNTYLRGFLNRIVSNFYGFEPKARFEAEQGSEQGLRLRDNAQQ
ncbi:LemA family protein [Phaeocystidibacter luteus]|uniref:LemA family protein n=1 Tax=Phaeocystidibacter luteus TaxID=911197 RepID=A0A6N6RJF8_9FLAO|nr:LemA family protein [Phaeocystidibacter luteus]KAB2813788.1 LemA family protein [Phaeocystidibacter luteus]